MSVGLLVVRLLYRLLFFCHLSKWFAFSFFVTRLFDVSLSFTLAANSLISETNLRLYSQFWSLGEGR